MKVSKKRANEVIKTILGYVPKDMKDNYATYEFYSGMINVSIFKDIEEQHYSKEYKYFEIQDKEKDRLIKYNGPTIIAQIFIQNEAKQTIKLNAENLQTVFFEYNEEIEDNGLDLE